MDDACERLIAHFLAMHGIDPETEEHVEPRFVEVGPYVAALVQDNRREGGGQQFHVGAVRRADVHRAASGEPLVLGRADEARRFIRAYLDARDTVRRSGAASEVAWETGDEAAQDAATEQVDAACRAEVAATQALNRFTLEICGRTAPRVSEQGDDEPEGDEDAYWGACGFTVGDYCVTLVVGY